MRNRPRRELCIILVRCEMCIVELCYNELGPWTMKITLLFQGKQQKYKEMGSAKLLCNKTGAVGLLYPSSLYNDRGSTHCIIVYN